MIGIGVLLTVDEDLETCTRARIVLGVAAPTPMRAVDAEKHLIGKKINENVLIEAGKIAADESKVRDSVREKPGIEKK